MIRYIIYGTIKRKRNTEYAIMDMKLVHIVHQQVSQCDSMLTTRFFIDLGTSEGTLMIQKGRQQQHVTKWTIVVATAIGPITMNWKNATVLAHVLDSAVGSSIASFI